MTESGTVAEPSTEKPHRKHKNLKIAFFLIILAAVAGAAINQQLNTADYGPH